MKPIARYRTTALTCICMFGLSACEQPASPATETPHQPAVVDAKAQAASAVKRVADRYYEVTGGQLQDREPVMPQ